MSYSRRLENVLEQIETVEDNLNKNLIQEFSKYLISKDSSASYQRNCIKIMLMFANFLQSRKEEKNLSQVNSIDDILAFLDTRRKTERNSNQRNLQIQRIHYYNCGCSISLKSNLHTRLEIECSSLNLER